jgi:hypothetical protein
MVVMPGNKYVTSRRVVNVKYYDKRRRKKDIINIF